MRNTLLIIALCALSFAAGTFLTGTKAAPVTEDPDFEAEVTAGYVTIDQYGINYLSVDNGSQSTDPAVTLSLVTSNGGTISGIENGAQYRLLLIPIEER